MLLGLLADLHGDLDGFSAALTILDRLGADPIVCAGDVAERGGEAGTIVRLLQERRILTVKGNHDYTVVALQDQWRAAEHPDRLRELGRIIADDTLAYLRDLSESARLEVAGVRVLVGHGTPWSDIIGVFPDSRPSLFQQIAARYAADTDVIVLGHTHCPLHARVGDLLIVNPGSIYGVTIRDSHTCATLSLPDRELRVFDVRDGQPVDVPPIMF